MDTHQAASFFYIFIFLLYFIFFYIFHICTSHFLTYIEKAGIILESSTKEALDKNVLCGEQLGGCHTWEVWGWVTWVRGSKGTNISYKINKSLDAMHSMASTVNNTVMHIWKLLRR